MKTLKIYLTLLVSIFFLSACKTGVFTSEGGKEDVAYLAFSSSDQYARKVVTVSIDGKTTFDVKVTKERKARTQYRGDLYKIPVGKNNIKVTFEGNVLYDKVIYVTTQQTKKIVLP